MADGEMATDGCAPIEFVCLAKHRSDAIVGEYSVETYRQLPAYCARGATANHEWIRVPPTPLESITIGKMEDRPPEPAQPRSGVTRPR